MDIINLEYGCIVGVDGAVEVRDDDFTKTIFRDESGDSLSIGEGAYVTWETVRRGRSEKTKLVSFFNDDRRRKPAKDVTDNELLETKRAKPQCNLTPSQQATFASRFAAFRVELAGTGAGTGMHIMNIESD